AIVFVEDRAAGVTVTDSEARAVAELLWIDQAELLGAGPVGRDQRDRAQLAGGPTISLHADAEARDNEAVSDRRRRAALAKRDGGETRQRCRELDKCQVGSIGARRELRMGSDVRRLFYRRAAAVECHQPIFAGARHAVRGGQYEIGRDGDAAAQVVRA